jgi:hypothetical protein
MVAVWIIHARPGAVETQSVIAALEDVAIDQMTA